MWKKVIITASSTRITETAVSIWNICKSSARSVQFRGNCKIILCWKIRLSVCFEPTSICMIGHNIKTSDTGNEYWSTCFCAVFSQEKCGSWHPHVCSMIQIIYSNIPADGQHCGSTPKWQRTSSWTICAATRRTLLSKSLRIRCPCGFKMNQIEIWLSRVGWWSAAGIWGFTSPR